MDSVVKEKFESYPCDIREYLLHVRKIICDVAKENSIDAIQETLKWGEPSYVVKGGSTVRIDWKPKNSEEYAIYFHCKTRLVETFKEVYGDLFNYEGNRAIIFSISEKIPVLALKHCILVSLNYHKLKHLPLLGM